MEWLLATPWAAWLVAGIILALIEVLSLDLVFLMLGLAAALTSASTPINQSLIGQCVLFCVLSILLVTLLRPRLLARLNRSTPDSATNVHALVGQQVEVLEPVSSTQPGLVRLEGEPWTARLAPNAQNHGVTGAIAAGERVQIIAIEGATAVVVPVVPVQAV
ncbi:MAG: NfeD family protein [Rothia sp. (in: high G+C Gram-positive bacteria)]|uniref:NfeD family protein n=1 Tax=Rothia sp. (in: high G+C Gram-positive bacteria) TaxID=1885016 RepID=UPI0026E0E302|nr:NfeD family protein [Rothia sp. (in: high G+C Gram-positive bacteria)]MDO5750658.1 NfeD family protein [Rothia sp. (in: high G+C Gram-positive bacteria)]